MISWQRLLPWQSAIIPRSFIFAISPAAAMVAISCFAQPLQKDKHLTLTIQASEEIVVDGDAQADEFCGPADLPMLFLDKPPSHGAVCFQIGEFEATEAVVGDNACLGRMVRGVNIIYRPRSGYIGTDNLRYTAIGAEVRHNVSVDLKVLPGQPASSVVLPDTSASLAESVMSPGPMPVCTTPVS